MIAQNKTFVLVNLLISDLLYNAMSMLVFFISLHSAQNLTSLSCTSNSNDSCIHIGSDNSSS